MNKKTLKRFAISSGVTFISTFGIFFFTAIQSEDFSFSTSTISSLIISAVFVAIRAAAKLIVEFFISLNAER